MSVSETIELVSLCVAVLGMIGSIVGAIVQGKMKAFVLEKMEEAEASGKSGKEKLEFVIRETESKYKIMNVLLNTKSFVEKMIEVTKKINAK